MQELVARYWWIGLASVPALAWALKRLAEGAAWVDALPGPVRRKLAGLEPSYPGHWVVTATLRDGRRFARVVIDRRFRLASPGAAPFGLRDVADVAREACDGAPAGPAIPLS